MNNKAGRIFHPYGYQATVIFACLVFFILIATAISAQAATLIRLIEIKGNKKIEDETIRDSLRSRVGELFSKRTVQEDIKRLYSTGYFEDVRVEFETFEGGLKLIFILKEKPTIISMDFQGNKKFETDELKEKVTVTPGSIASPSLINKDVERIVSFYQSEGYWHVKVLPIIREISEDAVALTFMVDEGHRVTIKKIVIEGNKAISTKKIRKVMKTKERWLFSFITGSGVYKKEEIRADIERIRELYHSHGYIDVIISEPEITLTPDRRRIHIKITISEGDQYRVGEVNIRGNRVFPSADLHPLVKTATGEVFSKSTLRADIERILDLYMERGYARANINPIIKVNEAEKTVDITLSITEGEVFRIGRIEISGNTKTRDKVIRREMRLDEGDIFNKKLLKRSYQRINNLNYFEKVDISTTPRLDENLMDVHIRVKEKLTGMLSIGGGYSSIDKFVIMGEITQTNLFGKGLYLRLKVDLSARRKNYRISMTDPWFMDKPISASFSIYNEFFEYPDYDQKSTGISIGLGKELSEYVGGRITYKLERVEITGVSEDASSLIKEQEGKRTTSSISPAIWKDTRDNYLDPTSGSRHALYTTIAGLGGDNYFVKGLIDSTWYFPAKWNTTFSVRGRLGYATGFAGKELPLYERFYVGGINTVRGLGFGEAGPRNEEGEKIGGNKELIFNLEYIFPIEQEIRLKGVVFFDAGRAFDHNENLSIADLRPTAGFGIRWISPLGPIRLEWGFNLSRKFDESSSRIEFSLGGLF